MSCNNWRIANTLGGLDTNWFSAHRIPPPSSLRYQDYSAKNPVSEGATAKHGYIRAQLTWDANTLTRDKLALLRSFVAAAGRNRLFMTIDKLYADAGGEEWVDISGFPDETDPAPSSPVDRSTFGMAFEPYTITLNNINVVNNPANI